MRAIVSILVGVKGVTMSIRAFIAVLLLTLLPSVARGQTTVEYYHLDALGSVRVITDQTGAVIERHDYLPFGEEWSPTPTTDPRKFTGKERDAETGYDYFGARYLSAKTARFTTVDPAFTIAENLADPQRWNRYTYVRNNPLRFTDPDGRCMYPGADCSQYMLGAIKAVVNTVSDAMDLTNSATNLLLAPVTDFRFGEAPRFTAANEDQRRGMIGLGVAALLTPLAEFGAVRAGTSVGAAQVQLNRAAGNAFRDELAGLLQKSGRDVQTEISKATPFGRRFIDIEVSQNGRVLGGIETKTGSSRYLPSQRAKDFWLKNVEGYPVNVARDK